MQNAIWNPFFFLQIFYGFDFMKGKLNFFNETYPHCRGLINEETWLQLANHSESPEDFAVQLGKWAADLQVPEYLAELARLEFYVATLEADRIHTPEYSEKLTVNPTLQLFENSWKGLARFFEEGTAGSAPEKGAEHVIVWLHPAGKKVMAKAAGKEELLVLKMALEELSVTDVAQQGNVPGAVIQSALIRALIEGILIGPEPLIKRHYDPEEYKGVDRSFYAARIFTLQWHITQACDLHCRHCYDRDQYKSLSLQQALAILDDMQQFCSGHNVHGQITFTGGNPLLYPDFETLYQEAADRGFTLAILGNPTTREQMERLIAIQPPAFYQVSLEGLEEHNDYMRGKDHFKRVLAFLDLLRELNVYSMVMLTLSRDNMNQVLPLAEILRNKVDLFTFNRLSLVGEGANLVMADADGYRQFLLDYAGMVGKNPCLGIKDNLLNVIYQKQNRPLFGGCTGYGCGAAFNFITILADGEVHACRKFPSPVGNILEKSLAEIYHSESAERYRRGPKECNSCPIRPVCGGCLAVAHSHGLDIFSQKDPYCFIEHG